MCGRCCWKTSMKGCTQRHNSIWKLHIRWRWRRATWRSSPENLPSSGWEMAHLGDRLRTSLSPSAVASGWRAEAQQSWCAFLELRDLKIPQQIQPSLDQRRIAGPQISPASPQGCRVSVPTHPSGFRLLQQVLASVRHFFLPPGSGKWVNFGVTSESLNTTWDTRFEFGYLTFTSDWIFCNEGMSRTQKFNFYTEYFVFIKMHPKFFCIK